MGEPLQEDVISSQRCEAGSFNLRPAPWPETAKSKDVDAASVASKTLATLNAALAGGDFGSIADAFLENGYWRDHLALSFELRTLKGRETIQTFLSKQCNVTHIAVDASSAWKAPKLINFAPLGDVQGIQFYTVVTTKFGTGRGVVRLVEKEGIWKIWTFYTVLEELRGFEEPVRGNRVKGVQHGEQPGRKNWRDRRNDDSEFKDSDPEVLIIGAGQGGLTAHARLKMLQVPTLIIDSNDAVGDNWRKRYHQLVLHDPVWYDHMPYIKFPDHWPVFTPKDKLAEWFDSYAKSLELNIWMKSTLKASSWNEAEQEWDVVVSRVNSDGSSETRTLHPKHIIQATGHSGKMYFPDIPGRDKFSGDLLCHSSEFPGAREGGQGKKAVVIGACNSSHDICHDYVEKGYDVTMIQRSSTSVVSSDAAVKILLGGVFEENGPPTEDADIWLWGWPSEVFKTIHLDITKIQADFDAPLLGGLEKAGFKTDKGPDDAGLVIKYFQRGGGYYFDVGASQLIIDGKIKVKQGQEVTQILPHGLKFEDGTELAADEIIFATGYENMRTQARSIFGDEVADQVGDLWGWDEEGEFRGFWRFSGHPGFWFQGGNLAICRYFSRILALQIKAEFEGLID